MSGWIKLHRKLLKSRAWCGADAEGKVILITLLLTACHSVTHWQVTTDKNAVLNPGELFISFRRFAKSCGVSLKKLTSEFNRLAVVGFLECRSKREGTIVRIKNWECYQLADTPLDTLLGTDLETLANADTARASSENIAAAETPKGTALGTSLATHNKNYILLKNK
jgi:DNA-binding transcriptional regulator YhcF (GntR family)